MTHDPAAYTRRLRTMAAEKRAALLGAMDFETADYLERSWRHWAQDAQRRPAGDWRVWLMMAGRGFGKTRAGAEWVRSLAERHRGMRIALIGASEEEARRVMIEGQSGLLNVGLPSMRPRWEPTKGELTWPSGARAFVYSASNPESLRGPGHHAAWCDELGKWPYAKEAWSNLMLGLREGPAPKTVVTTTPRSTALLRSLMTETGVTMTGGRSTDNPFLPPAFVEAVAGLYGGTRLGRQELDGELIEDFEDALWTRDLIEECRVKRAPETVRVVIGVDPPAGGAGSSGDACGIVVVALGRDGSAYVIEDASVSGKSPEGWASAVAQAAARHQADRVIAEANNGGAMVASVLCAADAGLPVSLVHASRGKVARAEPVMTLYRRKRAFHAGAFPELEDELCGLVTGGGYEGPGRSPDRADALVWAMSELMLGAKAPEPRVRGL